jgi:preprotein translocase subunit SecD
MTTIQKTLIAATFAVLAGSGLYQAQQAWRLRDQVQALQQLQAALTQQLQQASSENKDLASRLAQTGNPAPVSSERLRELLRLRGEVGVLRRQQRELEQSLAAARAKEPQPTAVASAVPPQPSVPRPFAVQLVSDEPGDNTELMTNNAGSSSGTTLHVDKTPLLDYTAVRSVNVTKNTSSGQSEISVELSEEGKELFAAITREHLNKRLAIVLNGQVYAAPVIRSEITGGKAQISGNFTEEEAQQLAAKIIDATRY